jgi:hypothetical protein
MTDAVVQILPDNTGKAIDLEQLTRSDGTVVYRQRVVIADPDDETQRLSLQALRSGRQNIEILMIEAIESSVNSTGTQRAHERTFGFDRRGATTGRGAIR